MTTPTFFRQSNENTLTSYNYIDIADGTGVQTFYALHSYTNSGAAYFLSSQADYGSDEVITATDVDIDLTPFNIPRDATGIANINFYGRMSGGGTTRWWAQLSKVSGGVETPMGSGTSGTYPGDIQIILKIPITDTHFVKGDVLRLTIMHSGTGTSSYYISASKPIKINVPFKINL